MQNMIKEAIIEWLKEILIGGILSNLSGMFDSVNEKVGEIGAQVGTTPQTWKGSIYSMIRNLSDSVILPIAGAILAFVMTLELIQFITDKNNMHDVDIWMFFKWVFKTACAEYDFWNAHMKRYVRRGSKGIALIDSSGDRPKLRYVFDVSDTGGRENAVPVWLWRYGAEHEDAVTAALEQRFDVSSENGLRSQLEGITNQLATEY